MRGEKEEDMKKDIMLFVMIFVVTHFAFRAAYDWYINSESIKVEALTPDFVWGDDVQFVVTLKGDEKELYVAVTSEATKEVTLVDQMSNRQFLITVRTGVLDSDYYHSILVYGDKTHNIELKQGGR